jgi:hypothetical protein
MNLKVPCEKIPLPGGGARAAVAQRGLGAASAHKELQREAQCAAQERSGQQRHRRHHPGGEFRGYTLRSGGWLPRCVNRARCPQVANNTSTLMHFIHRGIISSLLTNTRLASFPSAGATFPGGGAVARRGRAAVCGRGGELPG